MSMRPTLHFTARSGWINDPHGITFRDGRYHAFFQYVPGQTVWGPNCHWGHATGPDLLSLREDGIALAPGEGDDGIWTGSLVTDDDGDAVIFYTATSVPDFGIGRVRQARPADDGWDDWIKGAVVAEAPTDLDIIAYRDPFVRREGERWRMFVGAALRDGTATALSYVSDDLDAWAYDGIALQRHTSETSPVWMGALWECPQIFDLDGRAVMVSSVWDDDVLHYAGYAVGTYTEGVFTAQSWGRLTYGDSYYAPSLFRDADGRPCLSFWMRGVEDHEEGWASAHSVPHLLSLDGDVLVARPHPDVAAHRGSVSSDGAVMTTAADARWRLGPEDTLTVGTGSAVLAELSVTGDELTVSVSGQSRSLPVRGDVRVIVDGSALEVSSSAGLFAAAVPHTGESVWMRAGTGSIDVFPLD